MGITQSVEGLSRQKVGGRKNSFLPAWVLELGHQSCPALSVPASQVFGLRLNYTTVFLEAPACRRETVGLLSFHDNVSQFLIIKLFLYIYIFYWFCFFWRILTNIRGYLQRATEPQKRMLLHQRDLQKQRRWDRWQRREKAFQMRGTECAKAWANEDHCMLGEGEEFEVWGMPGRWWWWHYVSTWWGIGC